MSYRLDYYEVKYNDRTIGYYNVYSDHTASFYTAWGSPWDIEAELKALNLDKEQEGKKTAGLFKNVIQDANRVPGTRQIIYQDGPLRLEREPQETNERYSVYRRSAEKGDPDYSPLPHDAPHWEGDKTPEGMREWASWYAFNKMDDGTYQAELDEAWWWGGGHNDGGTIRRPIPEEWFELPYEEFLENVVTLAAAAHYGFTAEMLLEKKGLKEFFGFKDEYFRVISNQVRFGCGYRTVDGVRQYYAWNGYPNRNDDFITYAEITEMEYESIESEYPREIEADRETAECFRRKYVNGHKVLREGWNVSL